MLALGMFACEAETPAQDAGGNDSGTTDSVAGDTAEDTAKDTAVVDSGKTDTGTDVPVVVEDTAGPDAAVVDGGPVDTGTDVPVVVEDTAGPDAAVVDAGEEDVEEEDVEEEDAVTADAVVNDAAMADAPTQVDIGPAPVDAGKAGFNYKNDAQPIFQKYCTGCHNGGGSGGHNIAMVYDDALKDSYYCNGLKKGECTVVRIEDGSMPKGAGAKVPPKDIQILKDWIAAGMPE